MKLEEQVCSLELAKKLKELGVKQDDALYAWIKCKPKSEVHWTKEPFTWPKNEFHVTTNIKEWSWADWQCAAFTVAELGEMLPYNYASHKNYYEGDIDWMCYRYNDPREPITGSTEADARAKMLVYLIEQGIIKPASHRIEGL